MPESRTTASTVEREVVAFSGWTVLFVNVLLLVCPVIFMIVTGIHAEAGGGAAIVPRLLLALAVELSAGL